VIFFPFFVDAIIDNVRVQQMHLGYHELRNMLTKFREEREKRKTAPPPVTASGPSAASSPTVARSGERGEYRSSRDNRDRDRDRERGYDRRYELSKCG
jgi:hypothetical protein